MQRRLVHLDGSPLTPQQVSELKQRGDHTQIEEAQASETDYVARATRSGVSITAFRPPSSGSWRWQMPEGHHTSHGGGNVYEEAKNSGLGMGLKRTPMKPSLTDHILENQQFTGMNFKGASALANGKGLKESGLARTHHVSDSSVRAIIEYLHQHREWTTYQGGLNKVSNWIKSLTHGLGTADDLFQLLLHPTGARDLEAVINGLSNNPWNVGIGGAKTNEQVGPMRDASVTTLGNPSPQTFATDFGLQYLRGIVPDNILNGAGGQLVNDETSNALNSMEVETHFYEVPNPGVYNAPELTDGQLLAMINQELTHNRRWAIQLAQHFRGNEQEMINSLREENVRFRVTALGEVLLMYRGG
ncbi:hypothetical protein [Pseudoalteromonas ardens]|nr:hypothetical protein [Pseudoalteromonas sp. R96]MDK1309782.1 hypothetical protein [Pseudoalteromonas sp. R96]